MQTTALTFENEYFCETFTLNSLSKVSVICKLWLTWNFKMHSRKSALYASLRLVGPLKWWVSFAEYSLFYRALLQKRPIIWRSLLIARRESTHETVRHNLHNLHISLTFDNEFHVNFPPKYSFSKVSAVVYTKFSWVNSHIALTFEYIYIFIYIYRIGVDSRDFLHEKVSFAEYSLFYRVLLEKRPIIWRSLLIARRESTHEKVSWFNSRIAISRLLQMIGLFCKRAL